MHAMRYAAALSFFLITGQAISARACTYGQDAGTVCYLQAGYNDVYGSGYMPPQCDGRTIDSSFVTQIQNAVSLVQKLAQFQNDVCGLKYVFVIDDSSSADPLGDPSWGVWEADDQRGADGTAHHYTYIGLSTKVFNAKYSDIEEMIHKRLDRISSRSLDWTFDFDQDNPNMGLLFVIAHELGHIKFAQNRQAFVNGTDCSYNASCFYNNFIDQSWDKNYLGSWKKRRWTVFGKEANTIHLHSNSNSAAKNAQDICDIFRTLEFAGLFGSVSPDEDFVEMYRLSVLLRANPPPDPTKMSVTVANKGATRTCTYRWSAISGASSMVRNKADSAYNYAK